jgi:hypothetical protein
VLKKGSQQCRAPRFDNHGMGDGLREIVKVLGDEVGHLPV